jgi:multiple sugar transport system permease protein
MLVAEAGIRGVHRQQQQQQQRGQQQQQERQLARYAIWLSLHQYSVIHPGLLRWVGLDNYRDALKSSDFWSAVKVTFIFTAISVSLELVLGMGMALLMHAAFKGRTVLRAVVLVPWAILTVGTALTWKTSCRPIRAS